MSKQFDLGGKTALVTGSTRGIGRAIALGLAEQGCDIALHGSSESALSSPVKTEIRALDRRCAAFAADLSDGSAVEQLASAVAEKFGGVDILILNASHEERSPWLGVMAESADRHWAVNVRSSLILCQSLAPAMVNRGWGRIIAIGSIQEAKPNPNLAVYAATKAAQTSLVRSLARELAPKGVTVNNLAPGAIATDRNAGVLSDPSYRERVTQQIPAGRIGDAEDCVGACVLLASDAGAYINGATIFVDGGWHL